MQRASYTRKRAYVDRNALAHEIGISRTPLRDALLRLECEGCVEIHNRRGVCVEAAESPV